MATAYPFDPTGTSLANRVSAEQHVITAQNYRDYNYFIPKFAPFFERDFQLTLTLPSGTVRHLVYGVDYYFSNQFRDASLACAMPVYGSISFLDTDTFGIVNVSYNTVGDIWTLSADEILRILAEEMRNPRTTTWEQITDLPKRFPVVDHEWDLVDMTGGKDVVASIDRIVDAIASAGGGDVSAHINDTNNPHQVTKAQVGLDKVPNYAVATTAQAQQGTSNSLFMTPLRVAEAVASLGADLVNTHANNQSNPHQTTKAQVGLGLVQNYAIATQAQAEDGSLNTLYMTPQRTKEAITAQVTTQFNSHTTNTLNPHNVTKAQVGLNNVQNFAIASQEEAFAGTASDKYMTPQRTRQLVTQYVTTELDGHAQRTDNPHQTTAAQVGLGSVLNYGVATTTEAQQGTVNTKYMTALRTKQAIDSQVGGIVDQHASRSDNPHNTTKAQVGLGLVENFGIASTAESTAGNVSNKYMTPASTKEAIDAMVGTSLLVHVGDTGNPHQVTKSQVGLSVVENYGVATSDEALAGTAANKYMTPQRTKQLATQEAAAVLLVHSSNQSNPHQVTKAQVGLGAVENYGVATTTEATQGTATNKYMTPALTVLTATALVNTKIAEHASDSSNPHNTTAAQIGLGSVQNYTIATLQEAEEGTSNVKYMTPLRVKNAIFKLGGDLITVHSSNKSNPHAVTKDQVGLSLVENLAVATTAEAVAANSVSKYMTPALVRTSIATLAAPASHLQDTDNPHSTTAAQVGAYTKLEVDTKLQDGYISRTDTWVSGQDRDGFIAAVRNGKVADSNQLGGMTLEQLLGVTVSSNTLKSYDKSQTPNPTTVPNYWIEVGYVQKPDLPAMSGSTTIALNHPDAYWFLSGGHKQEATPALNAAASSPAYIIHAQNGGSTAAKKLDVTRLVGTANSDVKFGYTTDADGAMHVFMKVSYGYNGVSVTNLAELGSVVTLSDSSRVSVEPTGIVYAAAATGIGGSGGDYTALEQRVKTLEDNFNSVTVQ